MPYNDRICIFPGSFDPLTRGHTELLKTVSPLFDTVYIVILTNTSKKGGLFSPEEKLAIAEKAVEALKNEGYANIRAILYEGLTTDAAKSVDAGYMVRGVRNVSDYLYETEFTEIIRRYDSNIRSVMIQSKAEDAYISSTYVRDLIKYRRFDSPDFAPGTNDIIRELSDKKQ